LPLVVAGSSQVIAQYYQLIRLGYEVGFNIYEHEKLASFETPKLLIFFSSGIQECYGELQRQHASAQRRIGADRQVQHCL
jgi:hypothetical protein